MKASILSTAILLAFSSTNILAAGTIVIDQDKTITDGMINATDADYGIHSAMGFTGSVKDTIISVTSKKNAVRVENANSQLNLGDQNTESLTITVDQAEKALGVLVKVKGTSTIDAKNITINTSGTSYSRGIETNKGGSLVVGSDNTENISIVAKAGTSPGATYGVMVSQEGAQVHLKGRNLFIKSDGFGIFASHATELENPPSNISSLIVDSQNTHIQAGQIGLGTYSNGLMKINGNLNVTAPRAIEVRGNSQTDINTSGKNTIVLNGDIAFATSGSTNGNGDVIDATLNLHLTNSQSSWTGNLIKEYPTINEGEEKYTKVTGFTLTLANGAKWTPTAYTQQQFDNTQHIEQFAVNNLNMNGGVIDITDSDISISIENLKGQGIVNLATDLKATNATGKLSVAAASKESRLDVNLLNKEMTKVLTADDLTQEQASSLLNNIGGKDVTTKTEVPAGLVKDGFMTDNKGNTISAGANPLLQSTLELASSAPLALNRIMMNDVRKRLGDIRTTNGTHGAWARYDGGKLSGDGGLENDFHTVQIGIDTVPTPGSARMGVAFSYTDSDAEYARGNADMKAYSLAMYATKMFDNGMFVDVIGRMGTADTDLVVDGQHKGSMNNVALSVSGEMGWRFDLTDMAYIEPQAEVTYTYVNDDKLTLSSAHYDIDAVNSLMGRVGFAAGLKCPDNFGNVYVRASAVHEFLGDSKITGVNGDNLNTYEIDGKDTWVEYGIGANFNVTKSTYVWADVERTTGGALDEDWRATVGVRYAW